jgi:triosephosphate isomerase
MVESNNNSAAGSCTFRIEEIKSKDAKIRTKIVAANWKMHMDNPTGLALFSGMIDLLEAEVTGFQQMVVCCSFIHLHALAQMAIGHPSISVGAENCHEGESGAFTGEISAGMIRSTGANHVIVGHSERRKYAGETSALVCQKTESALRFGLKPIVCIGETKDERAKNRQFDILKRQLDESVFPLDKRKDLPRSSSPMSPSGPSAPAKLHRPTRWRRCIDLSARRSRSGMVR